MRRLSPLLGIGLLLATALPAQAQAQVQVQAQECAAAITLAERAARLPANVLPTLAVVESGRLVAGRVQPWPWTINVDGIGHFYETKPEAVAAVQAFQAAGARSIDVGCMQINLGMHPRAFASLDEAFDPQANTRYGAQFLRALYAASGQWSVAITAYHSTTPVFAADYARKILAAWPGAAALGLAVTAPAPGTATAAPEYHDYTEAFARQVAADMATRRARLTRAGPARSGLAAAGSAASGAAVPPRSLLRIASAEQRHGSAWPHGTP